MGQPLHLAAADKQAAAPGAQAALLLELCQGPEVLDSGVRGAGRRHGGAGGVRSRGDSW